MSQYIESQIEIEASIAQVWKILVDFPSFPEWNPFIISVVGAAAPGARLNVSAKPPGHRFIQFRPTVLAVLPDKELRWLGRLGLPGLFDGEHGFRLETRFRNRTVFTQYETFSGLFVPFLWRGINTALEKGFDAMNQALKRRAENPTISS